MHAFGVWGFTKKGVGHQAFGLTFIFSESDGLDNITRPLDECKEYYCIFFLSNDCFSLSSILSPSPLCGVAYDTPQSCPVERATTHQYHSA